jgi:predicted FMN-binding regulatory protein PaiB
VICDPCKKLQNNILVQQNRKSRSSSAPAKAKAPLTACSSEKLRATVVAKRLECKQLEDKMKKLQDKIEKTAVSVSEPLEKDLMTIMSGQNLDSTPLVSMHHFIRFETKIDVFYPVSSGF